MPGHIRQHTLCMFVAWSIAQLSDHSAVTAAGDTAPLLSWQRICAGCWQRGYAGCRERGHDQGHSSGERADRVHLVTLSSPRPQVVVACSQRAPQLHSWRVLLMCASPHVLNYEQSCLTPAAGLREKHKHHSKHHSADCARPAELVDSGAPGTKNVCLNLAASTSSVSRKVACSPTHFRAFTAFTAPPQNRSAKHLTGPLCGCNKALYPSETLAHKRTLMLGYAPGSCAGSASARLVVAHISGENQRVLFELHIRQLSAPARTQSSTHSDEHSARAPKFAPDQCKPAHALHVAPVHRRRTENQAVPLLVLLVVCMDIAHCPYAHRTPARRSPAAALSAVAEERLYCRLQLV